MQCSSTWLINIMTRKYSEAAAEITATPSQQHAQRRVYGQLLPALNQHQHMIRHCPTGSRCSPDMRTKPTLTMADWYSW